MNVLLPSIRIPSNICLQRSFACPMEPLLSRRQHRFAPSGGHCRSHSGAVASGSYRRTAPADCPAGCGRPLANAVSAATALTFDRPGDRIQISRTGGSDALWRADSRELYYEGTDGLMASVLTERGGALDVGTPQKLFILHTQGYVPNQPHNVEVAASGQKFLVNTIVGDSDNVPVLADNARIRVDPLDVCWRPPARAPGVVEPGAQWLLGVGVAFPELAERAPSDNPHPRSVWCAPIMGASRGKSSRVQMPQACETVPFSCRLEDATSGNTQQLRIPSIEAGRGRAEGVY